MSTERTCCCDQGESWLLDLRKETGGTQKPVVKPRAVALGQCGLARRCLGPGEAGKTGPQEISNNEVLSHA